MNDADKKLLDLAEKATSSKTWFLDSESPNDAAYILTAADAVPRLIAEKEALRLELQILIEGYELHLAVYESTGCLDFESALERAKRALAADDAAAKVQS